MQQPMAPAPQQSAPAAQQSPTPGQQPAVPQADADTDEGESMDFMTDLPEIE
jgi:hypothetical protein